METDDPRAALKAKDVTTRSAAARDLARIGGWDDIAELVRMATEDKSSAVRLYTAAAAADIAYRLQGAGAQSALDKAQRQQLHQWVKSIDPGANPGLLMLLSAVPDDAAVERLGRMLKDPRNDVRAGAVTALRRMALSSAAIDFAVLHEAVRGWLAAPKMPPDMLLELIRLVGEVGWTDLADAIRGHAAAGRLHTAAIEEAHARLDHRQDPAWWDGVYISDGYDVLEVGEGRRDHGWAAIRDGRWFEPGGRAHPFEVEGGVGRIEEPSGHVRAVWAPKVGQAELRFVAIQSGLRTWWRQEGKDLAGVVDDYLPTFSAGDEPVLGALSHWLAAVEGAPAVRARAILALRSGDPAAGARLLEELVASKKPRIDVYYWLGRCYAELGKKKAAREALDQFLEKSPKRGDFRKEAEDLRATL